MLGLSWAKLALYLLPVFVLVGLIWGIYSIGSSNGAANVQAKWNAAKIAQTNEMQKLKDKYAKDEITNRLENVRITHDLSELKQTHAVTLANLSSERIERLRLSGERASIYQRQAEAGTVECRSLAGYTAQLDRSLEEGISLVKEFGATLEQRDGQLRALGAQLLNDRKLLGDSNESNGSSVK